MKITDAIERIDSTMANTYVVRHENRTVLIDAGMKSSAKRIISYFGEHSEKPDTILITHYHPDHIGGLARLVEAFHPEVYASPLEIGVIEGNQKITPAKSAISKLVSTISKHEPVSGVKSISDLPFEWMKAVETPGHTPGSTSFLFEKEKALFVGDAVTIKNNETSVNRQFSLDIDEAEKSRKKILSMDGVLILPGHGEPLRVQ